MEWRRTERETSSTASLPKAMTASRRVSMIALSVSTPVEMPETTSPAPASDRRSGFVSRMTERLTRMVLRDLVSLPGLVAVMPAS